MPIPPGTYPIGGPVVGIGVRPAASAELYAAGVVWIKGGEVEKIQRTGPAGSYVYTWVAVAPDTAGLDAAAVQALIDTSLRTRDSQILRLEHLTDDIELHTHSGWEDVSDVAVAGFSLAPLAAFTTDASVIAGLQYRLNVGVGADGLYVPILKIPAGNNPNAYQLARTGSSTDPVHGGFHGGSFRLGGFDYVFYAGSIQLTAGDTLTLQAVGTTYTTSYRGEVEALAAVRAAIREQGDDLTSVVGRVVNLEGRPDALVGVMDVFPRGIAAKNQESFQREWAVVLSGLDLTHLARVEVTQLHVVMADQTIHSGAWDPAAADPRGLHIITFTPDAQEATRILGHVGAGRIATVEAQFKDAAGDTQESIRTHIAAGVDPLAPPHITSYGAKERGYFAAAGVTDRRLDWTPPDSVTFFDNDSRICRLGTVRIVSATSASVESRGHLFVWITNEARGALAAADLVGRRIVARQGARVLVKEIGAELTATERRDGIDLGDASTWVAGAFEIAIEDRKAPSHFEAAVGASPAVLPEGTKELELIGAPNTTPDEYVPGRVLLSSIPAADRLFYLRGDGGDSAEIRMRYAPGTRTLTYDIREGSVSLTAIGER